MIFRNSTCDFPALTSQKDVERLYWVFLPSNTHSTILFSMPKNNWVRPIKKYVICYMQKTPGCPTKSGHSLRSASQHAFPAIPTHNPLTCVTVCHTVNNRDTAHKHLTAQWQTTDIAMTDESTLESASTTFLVLLHTWGCTVSGARGSKFKVHCDNEVVRAQLYTHCTQR